MKTFLILFIWIVCGIIGGLIHVIPYYSKLRRKYKIQYWILNVLFGFYTLYESIQSQLSEYRLIKLSKKYE